MHLVLNDSSLRTFELEKCELNGEYPWTEFLSAAAFTIRSTYHTTLEATPFNSYSNETCSYQYTSKQTGVTRIKTKRQDGMNHNNECENSLRIRHDYKVGDKILLRIPGILRKLSVPQTGPFTVKRVYTNGTIRIKRGSIVTEQINICHAVEPYFEPDI